MLKYVFFLQECSNPSTGTLTVEAFKALLLQTATGEDLLANAETFDLSENSQKLVVDIIARYHLTQKRKTTLEVLDDYAKVVTRVFKKERKVI